MGLSLPLVGLPRIWMMGVVVRWPEDIYYLFPGETVWQTTPVPLIKSGVMVYRQRQQLETEVQALSRRLLPYL